jgi:P-type conjugative transfer protein TrbJ
MRRVCCCLLALVLAAAAPAAHAQLPVGRLVFDPGNYAQNLLTAARTLEQIQHQIAQLEQQARMLARNPLQLAPELAATVAQARALFQTARGIAFDVKRIAKDLRDLYPDTFAQFDLDTLLALSDRWMAQSRQSLETAMEAEARAAESIAGAKDRIEAALGSSADAEGQTSAVQAGNQLLGVTAGQLAEIHALLIAQGRALESERMERLAREERAREILRRAFPGSAPAAPPPARSAF